MSPGNKAAQQVDPWGQERGVVAVRSGRYTPERYAIAVGHPGAFHALLAPVYGRPSGCLITAGRLGDRAVHRDLVQDKADDPVVRPERDLLQLGEKAQQIHSSRRTRIVVAEHAESAIAS